jgi:hypothetical protein
MLSRKSWPLSIWVSLFLVSLALTPLIYRVLDRPAHRPRRLTELTELLSRQAPPLYVVPMSEASLESGIYICANPRPREQLIGKLTRNPKCGSKWQGVVYCQILGEREQLPFVIRSFWQDELPTWGEYGRWIGPFLFFGDPELLQRIHAAMLAAEPRR